MSSSSRIDMNKFCCNRSTCPKRRQQNQNASVPVHSKERIDNEICDSLEMKTDDRETQISPSITSMSSGKYYVPTKNSEKSSEANFDRNNQNINSCRYKFCPSISSQANQTESLMCAVTVKCPSSLLTNCCKKCKRLQQANYDSTTTSASSSIQCLSKQPCNCKYTASSSSTSLVTKHFPVKLSLKSNSIERNLPVSARKYKMPKVEPIFVTSTAPRLERLMPQSVKKSLNTEEFLSCNSEDSDSDCVCKADSLKKLDCSNKKPTSDKNTVILELLHEVVHLISKDNPIREEALRITHVTPASLDDKSSKMTIQDFEIKAEPKEEDSKPSPISQTSSHPPCLCCVHSFNMDRNQPLQMPMIQPYNLMSTVPQIPEQLVIEASECNFKDCYSGDGSMLIANNFKNNLCCICSNITNICPKHGPVKALLKNADLPCPSLGAVCISSTEPLTNDIIPEQVKIKTDSSDNRMATTDDAGHEVSNQQNEERKVKNLSTEEMEEDVDEELYPRFVIPELKQPVDGITPCVDCLSVYDDEEPKQAEDITEVDEKIRPIYVEHIPLEPRGNCEPSRDGLMEYDDEDPSVPDLIEDVLNNFETTEYLQLPSYPNENQETSTKLVESEGQETTTKTVALEDREPTEELDEPEETEAIEQKPRTELNKISAKDTSQYIVNPLPTNSGNIYNFLPEIVRPEASDPKQIIKYNDSEDEFNSPYNEEENQYLDDDECELAKEKLAERRKRKERDAARTPSNNMSLATIKQLEDEGSPREMKFFIDSLIMDFKAMEYARRRSNFEKNIGKPKSQLCSCDSFPVTITQVTDLGANSLYVKWIIHDCYGIGGYEIYADGYLTNRFYNSKHEAAVITHIDVTLPHKIALLAQPSADEENLEFICNITKDKNKPKSLPWKTDKENGSLVSSALWTPSIFLYDPVTCKATAAPPNKRDNF